LEPTEAAEAERLRLVALDFGTGTGLVILLIRVVEDLGDIVISTRTYNEKVA